MMTDESRQLLIDAGMNYSSALERFMNNESMLEKFLLKFRKDLSYSKMLEAIENKDLDLAFSSAHSLKGVASNFSFDELTKAASDITEAFRAGDMECGIAKLPEVKAAYDKVDNAIRTIYKIPEGK